jgi:phosphohistidine phosphatase SixA
MAASGHGDARQRLREKFPTAALAVIDFAVDDWDRIHPHSAASTA